MHAIERGPGKVKHAQNNEIKIDLNDMIILKTQILTSFLVDKPSPSSLSLGFEIPSNEKKNWFY